MGDRGAGTPVGSLAVSGVVGLRARLQAAITVLYLFVMHIARTGRHPLSATAPYVPSSVFMVTPTEACAPSLVETASCLRWPT